MPAQQRVTKLDIIYAVADFHRGTVGIRVQESALQAAGMVLVAQPRLTMSAPVKKAMRVVMAPAAPAKLKSRALANIADMLRVC